MLKKKKKRVCDLKGEIWSQIPITVQFYKPSGETGTRFTRTEGGWWPCPSR